MMKGLLCVLMLLSSSLAFAELKLPALFSDNMVLQEGRVWPVWGWAAPGAEVTVEVAGRKAKGQVGADGQWMVRLEPVKAEGPLTMTVSAGPESRVIHNILVGEVWLCSGQSNMAIDLQHPLLAHYKPEIERASDPKIRLFTVGENVEATRPLLDVKGHWAVCTPESAAGFSAVGYFFGRELRQARGVPVGLICNAASGSPAEAWVERPLLEADPEIKPYLDRWDAMWPMFVPVRAKFNQQIAEWNQAMDHAKAAGQPEPPAPAPPKIMASIRTLPWMGSCFYNGILAPLMPYAIRGVIWYQGESNVYRSWHYRELLPLMIKDWRKGFGQGDFPFLIVQLPAWEPDAVNGGSYAWAQVREGQLKTALTVPDTALVTTLDLNAENDLHPKNKLDVARRLALAARGLAYGEKLEYAGPIVESTKIMGDQVAVRFSHLAGGLVAKPGPALTGFEVAGPDYHFVSAEASIKGDTVQVGSPEVKHPTAVRYAWANRPAFSLYNKAGLPASPFRTYDRPEAQDASPPDEPVE